MRLPYKCDSGGVANDIFSFGLERQPALEVGAYVE
jgi:hypothetical protein